MLLTPKIHRFIFLLGLTLALSVLPFSPYALSVGLIILSANWLLDGSWSIKFERFRSRKTLWAFLLIYGTIVIGTLYSSNIGYAIKELKLWLPLLIVPLVIATSAPLNRKEFLFTIMVFCLSVLIASVVSFVIYVKYYSLGSQNVRAISPFISHIRLALMVNLTVFILAYFAFIDKGIKNYLIKGLFIALSIWLIAFLFVLQSFTGIGILGIVLIYLTVVGIFSARDSLIKYGMAVAVTIVFLLGLSYTAHLVDRYFTRSRVDLTKLPLTTVNGNPYLHNTSKGIYENGNLVWINICEPELKREWNRVSKFDFDGKDKAGQAIHLTLIRYLTSKGLRKDSVGVSRLDSIDINLIENSVASVIYRDHKTGIYPRFYQLLWEIDAFYTSGQIGGSSFVQRFVFLKASWQIIKNNWLFGVGPGDGKDSLLEYYKTAYPNLDQQYWFISHNEYLTIWIASGIIGLIVFLNGLFYPYLTEKKYKFFLSKVFMIILLVSMINEDTFETHIGVSFVALFYSILIFGYDFTQDIQE